MNHAALLRQTQDRFLAELRHHFRGWSTKVATDFSKTGFEAEVRALKGDPVYSSFGLASPEYALIRLMGRMSISIGRRLGEIYDKLPRFVAQARFGLTPEMVAPKIDGGLQLDLCIPTTELNSDDKKHALDVAQKHLKSAIPKNGLAVEIRYNFNPNDSARLRKDVQMAQLLETQELFRIYLIFSTIFPRHEAIDRLRRAGWTFLIGDKASAFLNDLIGMDLDSILANDKVRDEIRGAMASLMRSVYESPAVGHTTSLYETGSPPSDVNERFV